MVITEFNGKFIDWLTGNNPATGVHDLFTGAAMTFFFIACGCLVFGVMVGYVVAAFRHGPVEAFYVTASTMFQAVPDFLKISPRRVFAIAKLAVKEAFRRKIVLAAAAIFAVALLFGGWFLDTGTDHPERTYIGIISWGTQLLLLMMGMLVSSFSLPEDIRNKTIHTVVTKPVRPTEILLGRILGFTCLLTVMLLLMASVCLAFVWRGLSHTHRIDGPTQTIASFVDIDPVTRLSADGRRVSDNAIKTAWTTKEHGHRHRLQLLRQVVKADEPDLTDKSDVIKTETSGDDKVYYRVIVDTEGGHSHRVTVRNPDTDDAEIQIGPSVGFFRARVPIYASGLVFTDREGKIDKAGGVNVGDIWTYRGYVAGGASLAKAMFDFDDFQPSQFQNPDRVDLEMTLGVYRSFKGEIGKRILASVSFESLPGNNDEGPVRRLQTDPFIFESVEYEVMNISIPRTQICQALDDKGNVVAREQSCDLFNDLAKNGRIRVVIRCEDRGQYIGVGRADVYFRASEKPYWLNFFRGFWGIWLQLLVIVTAGVCFSTLLATPVTMFAAIVVIVVGFNAEFLRNLLLPNADGGGPIESFVRVVTQMNMQTPFTATPLIEAMKFTDKILLYTLDSLTYIVPNFSRLDFSEFVRYGYWIDGNRLLVATSLALSFCLGLYVLGYFNLKTRELAA